MLPSDDPFGSQKNVPTRGYVKAANGGMYPADLSGKPVGQATNYTVVASECGVTVAEVRNLSVGKVLPYSV